MQPVKSNRSQITAPNSALPMQGFAAELGPEVESGVTSILTRRQQLGVDVLDALDAAAVRRWSNAAAASLEAHREEIDRLNVFPVHDSDTGTNMATTLRAAVDALAAHTAADAAGALQALARGAVLGASGNSGNIVAQLLRAIADAAVEAQRCDAAALRDGLRRGAVQARAAVADPVEGTILTVAAAAAAALPDGATSLAEVAALALAAAAEALQHTPEQLPVLAAAGVVDAGGQGLVLVLEALVLTIGGATPPHVTVPRADPEHAHAHHDAGAETGFEVQYLLDTAGDFTEESADALRGALVRLGDSVVVVGTGDGTWSVHVHTGDAGAAVEAGIAVGRPYRITVSPFDGLAPPKAGAVIAIVPGAALGRLFESEGVRVVATDEPSVRDVVEAVLTADAREVVLLPNNAQITSVADAAAAEVRERGVRVAVVPTRSPVQGLAAVAVHDSSRRFDDDVVAMAEAAAATRFAEVTIAERESLTSAGICQAGDVLGLIDGEVVEIGRGILAVALAVSDRLLGIGAELMTVLVGAAAQPGVGTVLRRHVRDRSPLTEVTVYEVGQPECPLIIGIE
jgi:DAK2 domain fusion protein YloV